MKQKAKKDSLLKIKKLTPKETRSISSLVYKTPELYESRYSRFYTPTELKNWLQAHPRDILLVAWKGKRVVGFLATRFFAPYWADIEMLVVNPKFRNLGIGSALVQESLKRLKKRKIKRISLLARKRYRRLTRFWHKQGFQTGYQFVLMEKELEEAVD